MQYPSSESPSLYLVQQHLAAFAECHYGDTLHAVSSSTFDKRAPCKARSPSAATFAWRRASILISFSARWRAVMSYTVEWLIS
jgi:hypothetical protein